MAPGSRSPGRWLAIGAAALACAACSDANVSAGRTGPPPIQTGVFRAGNVAGLDFASGSEAGVTNAGGEFTCQTGQPVSFSLGNVELGQTVCTTVAHPAALAASGLLTDPKAINLTRLLMLLDTDQEFGNGIVISDALRSLADSWAPIDFEASDFEAELSRVIADIGSVEDRAAVTVPSSTEAFDYLDTSLSCAYSGLFTRNFLSGMFNAPTEAALIVYREHGSSIDRFKARLLRPHNISLFSVDTQGIVELKTLPSLISAASGTAGRISAVYLTPDELSGFYSNALAQRFVDQDGLFSAGRDGTRSPGDHRFTGLFTGSNTALGPVPLGFFSFSLDGDTLSGEAFDFRSGTVRQISGTRLSGDSVELSVELVEGSATATLVLDENGAPVGLQGAWPGIRDGMLEASGCRLL